MDPCLLLHKIIYSEGGLFANNNCIKTISNEINNNHNDLTDIYCENECVNKKRLFNLITENSYDIIFLLDKKAKILYENAATLRILGYNAGTRLSHNVFDFIHEDDKERMLNEFKLLLKEPSINRVAELRLLHSDGLYIWFEACAQNYIDNPYINGILINTRKIHNRKKNEQSLQEINTELQELNNTKDKLFAILAHDLKSSFQNILGYSTLLAGDINEYHPNDINNFASHIHSSTKATLNLLNNLLTWAEIQQGKLGCNPEIVCIESVIDDCLQNCEFFAVSKNITIIKKVDKSISLFIDKYILQTIIRNIVNNAIKFSYANSEVIISVKSKKSHIDIEVTDFGTGIDKNTITNLFEIGNKSKKGTNGEKGSGIGLALCNDLVKKINGSIKCNSNNGKGTTFVIYLPYAFKKITFEQNSSLIDKYEE